MSDAERPPRRRSRPASRRKRAAPAGILTLVTAALADLKAVQVHCIDVRHLTSVTDTMVIAGGRSDRHVRALADAVVKCCKAAGYRPLGVEGREAGEWVLVDLVDVVVHLMLPRAREFYHLEKLWDIEAHDAAEH